MINKLKDIIENQSKYSLTQLLNESLVIAKNFKNKELSDWVDLELNGYYDTTEALNEETIVPEYRTVAGQHSDQYGRPLIIENPKLSFVNTIRLRSGVPELEELSLKHDVISIQDPNMINSIKKHLKVSVISFNFSSSSIKNILNTIRTTLLKKLLDYNMSHFDKFDKSDLVEELINMHPTVQKVAAALFKSKHYRNAVLDTFIALNESVKTKSGIYDQDGTALMQNVFSIKNPKIVISDNSDEQLGCMWLFSGAVMGLRNPEAHSVTNKIDKQTALEKLSFASFLFKCLDKSIVK